MHFSSIKIAKIDVSTINSRVEDTRLEAKAKDPKKNPRPRLRTAFPRTDPIEAKDRNAQGQGPARTQASSEKFFRRSPEKAVFQEIFQALHNLVTNQKIKKIVLSSNRGQGNFRGFEASRPRT